MQCREIESRAGANKRSAFVTLLTNLPVLQVCSLPLPSDAASQTPVAIAVFPFELDDFSAGAAFSVANPVDHGQIEAVTDTVRKLLADSKRYVLVDVNASNAAAVRTHTLRDCNGCDADIARGLGADQSLIGVIRRISQTEFAVRIVIHNAPTGRTLADVQSGLHVGAAYSWSRGAAQVVKEQVLNRRKLLSRMDREGKAWCYGCDRKYNRTHFSLADLTRYPDGV